jgi:LSU ribosomal protein L14E
MTAIEVGRICIKTAGREAGEECVIIDIIDKNFVEVVGVNVQKQKVQHKTLRTHRKKDRNKIRRHRRD